MLVETKLIKKEYLKLMLLMVYRRPMIIFLNIIGLVMITGTLLYAIGDYSMYSESPIVPGIMGFFFVLFIPISVLFRAHKSFSSNGRVQEKITYDFTDEKTIIIGETFSSEMSWEKTYKVKELKNWILIYQNKQMFNLIPKTAFGDQLSEFKSLVNKNNIKAKFRE